MTDTATHDDGGMVVKRIVGEFVARAAEEMRRGMDYGLTRGWGISWREEWYDDRKATARLLDATRDLLDALAAHRTGNAAHGDVDRAAADLANQAFMLADPERLTATARRPR